MITGFRVCLYEPEQKNWCRDDLEAAYKHAIRPSSKILNIFEISA